MKQRRLVLFSLILFISSLLSAFQTGEKYKLRINMIRYSDVIVEGRVTAISEVNGSYNNINEVVTVFVQEKIAGETIKSNISLKYPKNIHPDMLWHQPRFKVGDNFIAFLRMENEDYFPLGGAYSVFKIYDDKIEKSTITRNQFKVKLNDVRNFISESIELPFQNDSEGDEDGIESKLGNEFSIINSSFYGPLSGTTIEFQLNPTGALDKDGNQLSFAAVKSAIQRAINTWNSVTHSYATFTISNTQYSGVQNGSDHVSTITFANYYCNGYTDTHNESEVIHSIDIVFCKGYGDPPKFHFVPYDGILTKHFRPVTQLILVLFRPTLLAMFPLVQLT